MPFHLGFDAFVFSFPAGLQESSRVVPAPLLYAISLPQSAAHPQYPRVPVDSCDKTVMLQWASLALSLPT